MIRKNQTAIRRNFKVNQAKIDWGYAKDYVEYAWKIMQLKKPEFFIIATGQTHYVEYFVKKCFSYVGLNYKKYVKIDKKLIRPTKTNNLRGNTTKAKKAFKLVNLLNSPLKQLQSSYPCLNNLRGKSGCSR